MKIDVSNVKQVCYSDLDIPLGATIFLKPEGTDKRFHMSFVGMEAGRYIILRPRAPIGPQELSPQTPLIVRFRKENYVCGFQSMLIYAMTAPFHLYFLSQPESYEVLNLRQHDRASCFLPAQIFLEGEELRGKIIDISRSGCLIVLDSEPANMAVLQNDCEIFCQFHLENQDLYCKSIVRHGISAKNKVRLGVEFLEPTTEVNGALDTYLTAINKYLG